MNQLAIAKARDAMLSRFGGISEIGNDLALADGRKAPWAPGWDRVAAQVFSSAFFRGFRDAMFCQVVCSGGFARL